MAPRPRTERHAKDTGTQCKRCACVRRKSGVGVCLSNVPPHSDAASVDVATFNGTRLPSLTGVQCGCTKIAPARAKVIALANKSVDDRTTVRNGVQDRRCSTIVPLSEEASRGRGAAASTEALAVGSGVIRESHVRKSGTPDIRISRLLEFESPHSHPGSMLTNMRSLAFDGEA